MIGKLKIWTGNIIIAVVISIIIEMITPDENKKYVKVVTGIYILYVIINPFLSLINDAGIEEIKNIVSEETIQTSSNVDVAEIYILSLENALKEKIENAGYPVNNIQFYITQDYSDIVKIEIKLKSGSNIDVDVIQNLVLENYDIGVENIYVS